MVPSPPERRGVLKDPSGHPLTFPFELDGSRISVDEINPELPETFKIRCVINGVSGPELRYPEDKASAIWENEGNTLKWGKYPYGGYQIGFTSEQTFTINSFKLYIDGIKVIL